MKLRKKETKSQVRPNSSVFADANNRPISETVNQTNSQLKVSLFLTKKAKTKGKDVINTTSFSSPNKTKEEELNQVSILISSPNNSKTILNSELTSSCKDKNLLSLKFKQKKAKSLDKYDIKKVNINYKIIESNKDAIYFSEEDKRYATKNENVRDYIINNHEVTRPSRECFIKNKYKVLLDCYKINSLTNKNEIF